MSNPIKGLEVAFDTDLSEEGAEMLAEAIRCFQHVAAVRLVGTDFNDYANRQLIKLELRKKLLEVLK